MSEGSNSFSLLVHSIALSAQTAIQSTWAAVLLRSEDGDWFVTSADTRPDAPFIRLRHNGQVPKWLESQDAVLRANDKFLNEPAVQFDEWDKALFGEFDVQLVAPATAESGLVGVLIAGRGVAGNVYPVSALNYLKSVSDVAGLAVAGHSGNDGMHANQGAKRVGDDQVLRRMAHDLKGPLSTVMTYLDLVRQNKPGNLTEDQLTRIDKAGRSGRRLLRLLNDFVDFARLSSGSLGLDRTEFDLASLIAEVSDQMIPAIEARRQELRCTAPSNKITLWADRQRVVQVVSSLVANASRYSPDALPIDIEVLAEGNRLRVRVSDQGRGMNTEQLAKVFEPFDPDQPSRRSESDQTEAGSGLGLALAQQLVELHGGKLTLQSKTGEGTVAEFEMPVLLAGEGSQTEAA